MLGDILYNLLLMPLQLIFEFVFSFVYRSVENPMVVLVALSIVVNLFCLPLYKRADAIQEEERLKQLSMKKWTDHIKATFSGDERYMMINTYYRQQNYKPIHALKSSISLLLQIPFFMVAYRFLSGLSVLKGVSFWIFKDLGAPDAMFSIGTFNINIMPVIMTLINVGAAFIYLKGMPLGQKIQTYALAAIFLVLLYNSPSGLVIYWTCNQIFSLLKNVFMKLIRDKRILGGLVSLLGAALFIWLAASGRIINLKSGLFAVVLLFVCQIPLIRSVGKPKKKAENLKKVIKYRSFLLGCAFLTVFMGLVIPVSVLSASPFEFIVGSLTPTIILINTFCIYAGFFMVWFNIFYYLASKSGRRIFSCIIAVMSVAAVIDYFFFGKNLGLLSTYLVFEAEPYYTAVSKLLNLLIVAAASAVVVILYRHFSKYFSYVFAVMIMGSIGLFITGMIPVQAAVAEVELAKSLKEDDYSIPLSRNGKNVIVFELDRAISSFIPYIFQERPELNRQYDGFVYYPNTLSYGPFTNYAVPAVYGGYEYTPVEMDKRADEPLKDKHNEALKMMPALLGSEGFQVTSVGAPYGNYLWFSDLSIFDDLENVRAFDLNGLFLEDMLADSNQSNARKRIRNFFYYSIFKAVPEIMQETVYDDGDYYGMEEEVILIEDEDFLDNYAILKNLHKVTEIQDTDSNCMFMINNNTTHQAVMLDPATYEPSALPANFDNFAYSSRFRLKNGKYLTPDSDDDINHYNVDAAALLKVADYLQFLKDEGIYDNTRIIIVSDHGRSQYMNPELVLTSPKADLEFFNPVLLVKDFGERGNMRTSEEFMTNADVPLLVVKDLVENPVNPFTGKPLSDAAKYERHYVVAEGIWNTAENNGNTFLVNRWLTVGNNVFDISDWQQYDPE